MSIFEGKILKQITMKKLIIQVLILCGIALFALSCNENKNPCQIERPKNLKIIDWDNYNDVYAVYWTYNKRDLSETWVYDDTLKTIKICGYLYQGDLDTDYYPKYFTLIDSEADISASFYPISYVRCEVVGNSSDVINLLNIIFAAENATKKCYVRGKPFLVATCIDGDDFGCCLFDPPIIRIYSADDVYFE